MTTCEMHGYTKAEVIKMQEGKTPLPTGVSPMGSGRNGYRLHRTINGKTYRFGTFQSLEHALRTNEYIGRLVEDLRVALDSKPLSKDDLESVIYKQDEFISRQSSLLHERILDLSVERKSLWKRLLRL